MDLLPLGGARSELKSGNKFAEKVTKLERFYQNVIFYFITVSICQINDKILYALLYYAD